MSPRVRKIVRLGERAGANHQEENTEEAEETDSSETVEGDDVRDRGSNVTPLSLEGCLQVLVERIDRLEVDVRDLKLAARTPMKLQRRVHSFPAPDHLACQRQQAAQSNGVGRVEVAARPESAPQICGGSPRLDAETGDASAQLQDSPSAVAPHLPSSQATTSRTGSLLLSEPHVLGHTSTRGQDMSFTVMTKAVANRYRFAHSTWDACVFIGLGGVPLSDSVLVAVCCFIAFCVQLLFCGIVGSQLNGNPLSKEDVESLSLWRLHIGHTAEHYDSITGTSLVSRVCDGSFLLSSASMQADLWSNLRQYLNTDGKAFMHLKGFDGIALCGMCISLWIIAIMRELNDVRRFTSALRAKCRVGGGASRVVEHNGKPSIEYISHRRFVAISIFTVIPRLFIALWLLFCGIRFLATQTELEELILNALALIFILDIDDVLFEAMVPISCRHLVKQIEPITLNRSTRQSFLYRYVDLPAVTSIAVVVVLYLTTRFLLLRDYYSNFQLSKDWLCTGNRDFIWAMDKGTGVVYYANTSSINDYRTQVDQNADLRYVSDAVGQLVNLPYATSSSDPLQLKSESVEYVLALDKLDASLSANQRVCINSFESQPVTLFDTVAANSIRFYLQDLPTSFDCEDLRFACDRSYSNHQVVRTLCPQTCGCSNPWDGAFELSGCSAQCAANRQARIQADTQAPDRSCRNLELQAVQDSPGWQRYFEDYARHLERLGLLETTLNRLGISDIVNESTSMGCNFVSSLVFYSVEPNPCLSDSRMHHGDVTIFCPESCHYMCSGTME